MNRKISKKDAALQQEQMMAQLISQIGDSKEATENEINENHTITTETSNEKTLFSNIDYKIIEVDIEKTYRHNFNKFPERTGEQFELLYENIKSLGRLINEPEAIEDESGNFGILKGMNRRNIWQKLGHKTIFLKVPLKAKSDYMLLAELYSDNYTNKQLTPGQDYFQFLQVKKVIVEKYGFNSRGEINGGLYKHCTLFGFESTKVKRYNSIEKNVITDFIEGFLIDEFTQSLIINLAAVSKPVQERLFMLYKSHNFKLTKSNIDKLNSILLADSALTAEQLLDKLNNQQSLPWYHEKGKKISINKLSKESITILKTHFPNSSATETFEILLQAYQEKSTQ